MKSYEPKLKPGDRFKVHGFPMLQKLEDGRIFKVVSIWHYYSTPIYKLKSGRIEVDHRASSVDMSIHEPEGFNNRLEVLK